MRLKTIDGLRGVAALAVVCFHLNEATVQTYGPWIHHSVASLLSHGYLGVDVFFVISGFVIAYSVRNADLSLGFVGRFALRRSIRLDPPYWLAIAVESSLVWLALRIGWANSPLPSTGQVLSHLVYMQNILGYGNIVDIFWTLCFEIQFYIGLILLLVLGRAVARQFGPTIGQGLAVSALGGLFVYSVLVRYQVFGLSAPPGFAIIRWFQFFMGVSVWWTVSGKSSGLPLVGAWLLTAGVIILQNQPFYEAIPIVVSALIWWAYRRDRMASMLSSRPLQFLGTISYSLYLFHASVGWRLIKVSGLFLDKDLPRIAVALVFGLGVGVCVFASWVAWKLVERPSLTFSQRVTLAKKSTEPILVG